MLVLASVVAAGRARQVYEATVMHALGARHALLRSVLVWQYLLLAAVTAGFALLAGSGLRLELGAHYLLSQMRLSPALLLRSGR